MYDTNRGSASGPTRFTEDVGKSRAETTKPPRKRAGATVGTAGFEPATPSTPRKCATGLRYVPPHSIADRRLR